MLEYRIRANVFNKNKEKIKLIDGSEITGLKTLYGSEGADYNLMVCDCQNIDNIQKGSNIVTVNEMYPNYDDISPEQMYPQNYIFNNVYKVEDANNNNMTFTFLVEKYYNFKIDRIYIRKYPEPITDETTGNDLIINKFYIYIIMSEPHYFDCNDEVKIYADYLSARNGNKTTATIENVFEVVTPWVLRSEINNDWFHNEELNNLYYALFGNYASGIINEADGDIYNVTFYRDNFLFTEKCVYEIYHDTTLTSIDIPLSQGFEINLFQNELLQKEFVDVEKKKAINKITDMERGVYHPVYYESGGESANDVKKIIFNLHFREHQGENWVASPGSFWNGTKTDKNQEKVKLLDCVNNSQGTIPYFSYNNASRQSDLLSYLDFNNNDVRYQKNKLKKSFLRLSFFDSMNEANQNLLSYAKIYMDTGNLFSKYAKNISDEPYFSLSEEEGEYVPIKDLVGLKTNREPYGTRYNYDTGDNVPITERSEDMGSMFYVENKRLSSQFVITDRNNSNRSSQGFYLYLWKESEEGLLPQYIYMKVDFNHAGYGRTIPMMLPFWDKEVHSNKSGFKTFEEILTDWSPGSNEAVRDNPYDVKQYKNFSYIRLVARFDKDKKMGIYYLDPDIYKRSDTNTYFEDGNLFINLYEAKIKTGEEFK